VTSSSYAGSHSEFKLYAAFVNNCVAGASEALSQWQLLVYKVHMLLPGVLLRWLPACQSGIQMLGQHSLLRRRRAVVASKHASTPGCAEVSSNSTSSSSRWDLAA
jgi:hypothetical protein